MRVDVLQQMNADKQYVRALVNLLTARARHVTTRHKALH